MGNNSKSIKQLTPADFEEHRVWRFLSDRGGDENCIKALTRITVSDLKGKLVATRVNLANGNQPWALIGNVDTNNPRLTKHFLNVSVERDGRWFHLARYHDFDYEERGPKQLAKFLGLSVEEVFPITYGVTDIVRGETEATAGRVLAEPEERISRAEIIALAVP